MGGTSSGICPDSWGISLWFDANSRILGLDRSTAAWFSFLLGLPAITLAGLVEIFSLLKAGLSSEGWLLLLLGLTSGSICAYLALKLLLGYLKDHSSWAFVWYRLGLGAALVTTSLTSMLR